jgi:hypothetical protein
VSRYSFEAKPPFTEVVVGWDVHFYFAQVFKRSSNPFRWHNSVGSVEALAALLARDHIALPDALRRQLEADRTGATVVFCPGDAVRITHGLGRNTRGVVLEVIEAEDEAENENAADDDGPRARTVRLLVERSAIEFESALDPSVMIRVRPAATEIEETLDIILELDMSVF